MVAGLFVLVLVVFVLCSLGLIIFILLHSGKGTGVSEMFGGMLPQSASGTGIIEKNLDRITIGIAIIWTVSLLIMMVAYPSL